MTPKDYMSSSHANWENIQIDSFTSWINQHLLERGLSVKDLSSDFQDGVLLLNLLEILSGKKIARYVRSPKFLQHKIDNIMIAFAFMEKAFDIKVFGCNAKDIVDGNLKQIMGVIFLLIQKIKVNLHLDHQQEQQLQQQLQQSVDGTTTVDGHATTTTTTTSTTTTVPVKSTSKLFYRASMATSALNRFSHITPNHNTTANSTTVTSIPSSTATTSVTSPSTTTATTTTPTTPTTTTTPLTTTTETTTASPIIQPIRILPTTGVSVSTIRSKFLIDGSLPSVTSGHNEKYNTFSPSSLNHAVANSNGRDTSTEKILKRTESGHVISGGLTLKGAYDPLTRSASLIEIKLNDHQSKFYDLKKVIFMQAVIRGYLVRLKWGGLLKRYRIKLGDFKQYFTDNKKAYRGLTRAQATIKGKIQRKKLYKLFPLYRRNEIVKEILSTEDKYVKSLAAVTTHYLKPSEAFLSTQQVRSIFSQIEIIHRYNSLIWEKLQSRYKIWYSSGQKIGDIFIEMSAFLKVYTIYVNNYNNSIQTITECMEIPKFASLLEKNRNHFGLDLSAFLIAPIQRIPRYILLLQDLMKNTKETHPDHQDLLIALKKMKDVAEYVNEKKREAENLNQVLTIQSSLTGKFNNLAEPHRRYVKKGTLVSNEKIYLYFLFNDLLVKTDNKNVSKIRDSARLSNAGSGSSGGSRSTFSFTSKETTVSEGKSKYLNSYFLSGSSLVDTNPDGFTFQIIGVGDANELNSQLANSNSESSPTLSFSPFSSSISSNGSGSSGSSGILGGGNSTSPISPFNNPNNVNIPTTSISLEALSLNEKMTWMSELDECIYQLLEKTRSKKRSLITEVDELTSVPFDVSVVKDSEFSGTLDKKHSEISWRSKKFYLKNTHLYYHRYSSSESPKEPSKIKCINLILCSVKLAQVVDRPHCFQLNTPSRIYFFSCEDSTVLFQWISSIRLSIKKKLESLKEDTINGDHHSSSNSNSSSTAGLNSSSSTTSTNGGLSGSLSSSLGTTFLLQQQKSLEHQQNLNSSTSNLAPLSLSSQDSILNIAGNNSCAECGASDPSWVSVNYGVVVCLDCSSIHKNLPDGNVKSVRSLSLANSDIVKQEGNIKANGKYEKNIPSSLTRPNPKDSYETKLSWIKAKYLSGISTATPTSTTPLVATTSIQVNDSLPSSPTLDSTTVTTATTSTSTTQENVKLENNNTTENGRSTPTSHLENNNNNNNRPTTPTPTTQITSPSSPVSTTTTSPSTTATSSPAPTSPITSAASAGTDEQHIEGLELKSGTDTSNGKGTWSRSGGSHQPSERKTSFLDKVRATTPPIKTEHEGYLYKTNKPTSKDSSDWKKYLFIYKGGVLTYYKVDKKNKRKEKGIIDLFHSVSQEPRPKQKYSFTLVTSQRLYFLASETESDLKTWVDFLSSHSSH